MCCIVDFQTRSPACMARAWLIGRLAAYSAAMLDIKLVLEKPDFVRQRLATRGAIIESRLHHPLDMSLDEDRSRVRHVNAALVLGMFRRLVVSCAQARLSAVQTCRTRYSVRSFQQQFARRDGGPARLDALVFAKSPAAWRLAK
jgi:hypothetical protein